MKSLTKTGRKEQIKMRQGNNKIVFYEANSVATIDQLLRRTLVRSTILLNMSIEHGVSVLPVTSGPSPEK